MSDTPTERIRDRNALIQSGYSGAGLSGTNSLAGVEPSLTENNFRRLETSLGEISADFATYSQLLLQLNNAVTPDGYINFDLIGGSLPQTVFSQGTVLSYSTGSGTATVGTQTVSFTNTTGFGVYIGDVVLLGSESGTHYLVGIISRSGAYTPPSYIAPSYTGFPLNGLVLGTGIKTGTTANNAFGTFVDYDAAGILGLGASCIVGFSNLNGTFKVLAHSINTALTSDLGWPSGFVPGAGTPPQLMIVADSVVLKASNVSSQPLYVWRLSTGWVSVNTPGGVSDRFSRMTVSGTEYLVVSRSGVGWYYYNIGTATWSSAVAFPSGATRVATKDGYMWTNNGYVSTSSLTPSWTLRHSGLSVATQMDNFRADISESGDLVILTQFGGPPSTWGITTYKFTTSTSTTKAQLFSATGLAADGEPQDLFRIAAGTGYIMVAGTVRADAVNPTLSNTEKSGAIWVTDGVTTAVRSQDEDPTNYSASAEYPFSGGYIRGNAVASQVGLWRSTGPAYVSSLLDVQAF